MCQLTWPLVGHQSASKGSCANGNNRGSSNGLASSQLRLWVRKIRLSGSACRPVYQYDAPKRRIYGSSLTFNSSPWRLASVTESIFNSLFTRSTDTSMVYVVQYSRSYLLWFTWFACSRLMPVVASDTDLWNWCNNNRLNSHVRIPGVLQLIANWIPIGSSSTGAVIWIRYI